MLASIAKFRNWFSPRWAVSHPDIGLPENILAVLSEGSASAVQPAVRNLFGQERNSPVFDRVLEEIRRRQWPEREIVKLEAWGEYYRGNFRQAYALAAPYLQEGQFDADLYLIASLAVYHSSQFQEGERLAALAQGKGPELFGRLDYWIVYSLMYWALGRHADAHQAIGEALRLDPTDLLALGNGNSIYLELGDMAAFEATYRELVERYPNSPEGQYALGYSDLALDRYRSGFERMEWRYQMLEAGRYINQSLLNKPRWRGPSDSDGKRVLLTAEQGLGDTIMLARYLPPMLDLGVDIVMECQPEALPLFSHNFPSLRTIPIKHEVLPKTDFDCWLATMSLPYVFNSDISNIPGTAGYLLVPPDSREYWRQRVAEIGSPGKLRIGLTWSGTPTHRADRRRSLPFPRIAERIGKVDAEFFALQTSVPAERPDNLLDLSEELVTLADTAALIEQMDLVITVDTSAVHVAGAIGHPTWLMLPHRYEWRWSLEGESNHWYDSVRVIRQPSNGDWDSVLDEVFDKRLPAFINSFRNRRHGSL